MSTLMHESTKNLHYMCFVIKRFNKWFKICFKKTEIWRKMIWELG